jgi:acetyl esterase/lipase
MLPRWKAELLSIDQNKDGPLLTREEMVGVYGMSFKALPTNQDLTQSFRIADYGPPDLTSPDVAPLLASSHRNLPPVYIQVCGLDPLRDEAFLYEKVLRESDVPTGLDM